MKNLCAKIFIVMVCITNYCYAQNTNYEIGIGVINDEISNTNKAFALQNLFIKKKYSNAGNTLLPKLVDYVYASPYGIDGTFKKNNVILKLYKDAKNIATIQCENKWKTILESLDAEMEKLGFKSTEKINKVDEGMPVNLYDDKMENNLPGNLTIKVPQNIYSDELKIKANYTFFKPKNIYEELKNLHGYSNADITESKFFKMNDIPKQLKDAIKPLVFPISNTPILAVNYIGYGNILLQQNDFLGAQHCYLQALQASKELLTSGKEKAIIRAFAFDKLAYLQPKLSANRRLLTGLYAFCSQLNKSALTNENLVGEHTTYYKNIEQIKNVCIKAEENAKLARSARFGMIMGAVAQGVNNAGVNMGADMSGLAQSMQSLDAATAKSVELMKSTAQITLDLRDVALDIKTDQFITDDGGTAAAKFYMAAEVLYYISQYPEEMKEVLINYASDKPNLKKQIDQFYGTTNKVEKQKILKQLYVQLVKIEGAITNFEVRDLSVSEKYLSTF